MQGAGRHRETVKPWVQAIPSSQVWSAELPDQLDQGTYTLTVRARDEFGRVHHAHRILEIQGSSATPPGRARYPSDPPR